MRELSEPESFSVGFKLEIAGTEQEILAAYMRYAQEHRDPMMDGWGSESLRETSTPEEVLFGMIEALHLEEQIRRVLQPLELTTGNSGLTVRRITPST